MGYNVTARLRMANFQTFLAEFLRQEDGDYKELFGLKAAKICVHAKTVLCTYICAAFRCNISL